MSILDISKKYEDGEYSIKLSDYNIEKYHPNHIFDEDKSVRWNRERVDEINRNSDNEIRRLMSDQESMENRLKNSCIDALMHDNGLTHSQATVVYNYCYDKHRHDMSIFFDEIIDMAKFAELLIGAEGMDY